MLKSTGGKPYKFYFSEIDNKHNKLFDIFHIETSIWMFFSFFHYLIYFINIHQLTMQTVCLSMRNSKAVLGRMITLTTHKTTGHHKCKRII